jgi:hypothetical protein
MIDLQVNGLTVAEEFHCNFWEGPRHLEIKKIQIKVSSKVNQKTK